MIVPVNFLNKNDFATPYSLEKTIKHMASPENYHCTPLIGIEEDKPVKIQF
jgi:hypothetical protein